MKKAQELSLSTIIIAVICLIVLVVIILIFTGKIQIFGSTLESCSTYGGSSLQKCVDTTSADICQKDNKAAIPCKKGGYCCVGIGSDVTTP